MTGPRAALGRSTEYAQAGPWHHHRTLLHHGPRHRSCLQSSPGGASLSCINEPSAVWSVMPEVSEPKVSEPSAGHARESSAGHAAPRAAIDSCEHWTDQRDETETIHSRSGQSRKQGSGSRAMHSRQAPQASPSLSLPPPLFESPLAFISVSARARSAVTTLTRPWERAVSVEWRSIVDVVCGFFGGVFPARSQELIGLF